MKKYIKFALLLVLLGVAFGFYQYNKPHKKIDNAKPNHIISAINLFTEFESDETIANQKYLDKIIEVSGIISQISTTDEGEKSITLESEDMMFGVICELDHKTANNSTNLKKGATITLKGICSGMLSDVVLVRCVVI